MIDDDELQKSMESQLVLVKDNNDYPVVSEIAITNTELHSIATGNCKLIAKEGEPFAIRFLLASSFKSYKSNYVVNKFIVQVIAVGKKHAMKKEDIVAKTKIQIVDRVKEVKVTENNPPSDFNIEKSEKEMW